MLLNPNTVTLTSLFTNLMIEYNPLKFDSLVFSINGLLNYRAPSRSRIASDSCKTLSFHGKANCNFNKTFSRQEGSHVPCLCNAALTMIPSLNHIENIVIMQIIMKTTSNQ